MRSPASVSRLRLFWALLVGLAGSAGLNVQGGGSGLNTVVVVNQASSNSVALGNYYRERRQIPPENLLRIYWSGSNISWSGSDFQTNLLQPLLNMIASRQLTNQIQYVVLSMDIPFQTINGATVNGTTSVLFYGLKPDPIFGWQGFTNSYYQSEAPFSQAQPATATGYSFLATMLTGNSVADAEAVVDQGVMSDQSFPIRPAILEKTSDPLRDIRYPEFDNAIFDVWVLGNSFLDRTNSDSSPDNAPLLGWQTGLVNFSLAPNTFVPGAMADSLTSFGGVIFGPNTQTSLLEFLGAGATGSYGTVAEPLDDSSKFPNPEVYFYQARGFDLAEAYYQSLWNPYLGLIVGEPLAAPFAEMGSGYWSGVPTNAVLSGTTQLGMRFNAADSDHPLQQIDLFVDGLYSRTLTNLAPRAGNILRITLNGYPLTYTVPAGATPALIAGGLTAALNAPTVSNLTKIAGFVHGDRIELHYMPTNRPIRSSFFVDWTSTNYTGRYYRVVYLQEPALAQIQMAGRRPNGSFQLHAYSTPGVPSMVEASTNLTDWVCLGTSANGGVQDFLDVEARDLPLRFYRLAAPDKRPVLSLTPGGDGASVWVHAQSRTTLPFVLQTSWDLVNWSTVATNLAGGTMDAVFPICLGRCGFFYRAVLVPQPPPMPYIVLYNTITNGLLMQINGANAPFAIEVSTNLQQWTVLSTNLEVGQVPLVASSSVGTADVLSTFVTPGSHHFLNSPALGLRSFVVDGTVQTNSWVTLTVSNTTGLAVSVTVTNQSAGDSVVPLANTLFDAINSEPALQGADGITAENFATNLFGQGLFDLRARSPGYQAATSLQIQLSGSQSMTFNPASTARLDQNISDLQPRNHLYVEAGSRSLGANFSLNTTTLSDGFHELTAVAYEGTHVRTQCKITLPLQIRNTSLSATMTSTDLLDVVSVQGIYHLTVTANTNAVGTIQLFSTGGEFARADGQPTAVFAVDGSVLGSGLHPFYAVVQTPDGLSYRTQTLWARFVNSSKIDRLNKVGW